MKRSIVAVFVAATLISACGASDGADTSAGSTVAEPQPVAEAVATTQATTTTNSTTTTTATADVPESTEPERNADAADGSTLTADEQAAADAWSAVFDSTVEFVDKEQHLADALALQPTVEAYTTAGSGFGGINLAPTSVVVDGDTATVVYDVNFGENPAYADQEGSIGLVDGVWMVDRAEFCAFMSSARVSCP